MKVYEKLGLPYLTKEQTKIVREICPANKEGGLCKDKSCSNCAYNYLNSEVPMKKVKRWETYNGDFAKASIDYRNLSKCNVCKICKYTISECFAHWLMEEIEIEVEE